MYLFSQQPFIKCPLCVIPAVPGSVTGSCTDKLPRWRDHKAQVLIPMGPYPSGCVFPQVRDCVSWSPQGKGANGHNEGSHFILFYFTLFFEARTHCVAQADFKGAT